MRRAAQARQHNSKPAPRDNERAAAAAADRKEAAEPTPRGARASAAPRRARWKRPSAIVSRTASCSTARSPTSRRSPAATAANSYQRLEFLGDHVLGLIISDMLFRAFPKADEGELSRRLADLVRREACADVARAIELGAALRLGASEANAGGRMRTAILADVCEALVGAVYLDGGYDAAAKLVERLWGERMRAPVRPLRDPKTILQEWAQARGLPTPTYREVERTGPHHDPEFRVAVDAAEPRAGRRARPLQAHRRAGRRRRHAQARRREDGSRRWLTTPARRKPRAAASSR